MSDDVSLTLPGNVIYLHQNWWFLVFIYASPLHLGIYIYMYCHHSFSSTKLASIQSNSSHSPRNDVPSSKSSLQDCKTNLLFGCDLHHHTFCISKAFEWCEAKGPCSCDMGPSWESSGATFCTFSLHPYPWQQRWALPKSSMNFYLLWCSTRKLRDVLTCNASCMSFSLFMLQIIGSIYVLVVTYICSPSNPLYPDRSKP